MLHPAFCQPSFYIAKDSGHAYSYATHVVLVREGRNQVLSIMSDVDGSPKDFLMVLPVPRAITKDQIHVADKTLFDRLDAYTAPRLMEGYDTDPCEAKKKGNNFFKEVIPRQPKAVPGRPSPLLGSVRINARYRVGEYEISVLTAKSSANIQTWLKDNGYPVDPKLGRALSPYVKQGMRFVVAKVHLPTHEKMGYGFLRPIQISFESRKFVLPLRAGLVNSKGEQEVFAYVIQPGQLAETANYRGQLMPTGIRLPLFVSHNFQAFYKRMFDRRVGRENYRVAFTESIVDATECEVCTAPPLSKLELKRLGVFWADRLNEQNIPTVVTRLHMRYRPESFPQDLLLKSRLYQKPYVAEYKIQHAWKGKRDVCNEAEAYFEKLKNSREAEAQQLASLTGWNITEIRDKIKNYAPLPVEEDPDPIKDASPKKEGEAEEGMIQKAKKWLNGLLNH